MHIFGTLHFILRVQVLRNFPFISFLLAKETGNESLISESNVDKLSFFYCDDKYIFLLVSNLFILAIKVH